LEKLRVKKTAVLVRTLTSMNMLVPDVRKGSFQIKATSLHAKVVQRELIELVCTTTKLEEHHAKTIAALDRTLQLTILPAMFVPMLRVQPALIAPLIAALHLHALRISLTRIKLYQMVVKIRAQKSQVELALLAILLSVT